MIQNIPLPHLRPEYKEEKPVEFTTIDAEMAQRHRTTHPDFTEPDESTPDSEDD